MLEYAFDFMEEVFGSGQEMVIFVTELNSDYYTVQFLQQYECERYYRYNRQLLVDESSQAIEEQTAADGAVRSGQERSAKRIADIRFEQQKQQKRYGLPIVTYGIKPYLVFIFSCRNQADCESLHCLI